MASGALASLGVKKEATYKTDPTGTYSAVFGHGTKITSLEKGNSIERIWGLGSRGQTVNLEKQFTGAVSIEYVMSNPWVFIPTMGKGATAGPDGNGIYTHTITEQDTLPTYAFKNNIELGATDAQQILLGNINASKTLSVSVGDPVVVSDDFVYATETFSTDSFVAQVAETFDVFSFAHGTLEVPNGTVIGNVQSAEISISNNANIIWGLGSRVGSTKIELNREYTVRATVYLTDPTKLWRLFYDGSASGTTPGTVAETATLKFTLDNGATLGANRKIVMAFTNVKIDSYSLPQDPTAPIMEDLTLIPRGLTVTAYNATSTIPAEWY